MTWGCTDPNTASCVIRLNRPFGPYDEREQDQSGIMTVALARLGLDGREGHGASSGSPRPRAVAMVFSVRGPRACGDGSASRSSCQVITSVSTRRIGLRPRSSVSRMVEWSEPSELRNPFCQNMLDTRNTWEAVRLFHLSRLLWDSGSHGPRFPDASVRILRHTCHVTVHVGSVGFLSAMERHLESKQDMTIIWKA